MKRHVLIMLLIVAAAASRTGFFGLKSFLCAAGISTVMFLTAAEYIGRLDLWDLASIAQAAAAQHRRPTYANCGWIGVRVTPMTAAFANSLGMAVPYGAIFATPRSGSPAAKARIEAGDVVTSVNGSPLAHARDFAPLIAAMAPGSYLYLNTFRDGQLIMVRLIVGSIKC